MKNKQGFTLAEIAVVVIIVGVLASLALPRYTIMLERTRSAEAALALGHVREAQMAYRLQYGTYAGSTMGLAPPSAYPGFDYDLPDFQFFDSTSIAVFPCMVPPHCVLAHVYRNDGSYHLHIQEDGQLDCSNSTRPVDFCEKMGLKNDYW